jgi:aldose 1-epimerase
LLISPDGDQGDPGELRVIAVYRLDTDTLWLDVTATTTKATPVSLSAHPYFNLAGPAAGDVLSHVIEIEGNHFLPTDGQQIPTGEIRTVAGTPFDFRSPATIGARIRHPDPQLLAGHGYDHFFVLPPNLQGKPKLAARALDPKTGRQLEILTSQPGLQFYSGSQLNGSIAGRGTYRQSNGLAFEPQAFPDAVNHKAFPSTILRPGDTYRHIIGYRFTDR